MRTFSGFFDTFGELEWLGIVVATLVVAIVLGWIFYGPLFGKQLAAATGNTYSMKFDPKRDVPGLIVAFVFQIGVGFLGVADDFEHSLVTALVAGVLLIAPVLYMRVVYGHGKRFEFLVDTAYWFFAIAIGGYIQGLFA